MFTTKLLAVPDFERGTQFGEYTLLENIGRGGEGVVWSAYDNRKQRIVALKIITASNNDQVVNVLIQENFDQQVHLIASLNHPHILPTYEFGRLGTSLFFAMRYNCAGSLANKLYMGPLPLEDVVEYAKQIASALMYLHDRTIIHRDLKPGNILLDGKGRTYLTDFGLAKQASDISMAMHTGRGTGPYASYEQHTHSGMMSQSDIFSYGIVLFEMLTGRLPWDGEQYLGLKQFQENAELPDICLYNNQLPPILNEPLRKMTALYWQDRPHTAWEAYQSFVNTLSGSYAPLLPNLEYHGEDVLLRENGEYILDLVLDSWEAETMLFPLRFTHFALVDAACKQKGINRLQLNQGQQAFMLRGALVHDYALAHWWQQNPDVETRIRICEQVMTNEEETAVARALSNLSDELSKTHTNVQLSPDSTERLVDLAVTQNNAVLRQNIFKLLVSSLPTSPKWQPVAFSAEADKKIALFALSDGNKAKQVASLLGQMHSETAVQLILDNPETELRQELLQTIYESAGSWPKIVPFSIRISARTNKLKQSILEDQNTVSLSRSGIGFLSGLFVSLLMVVGIMAIPNSQMRDVYFAPVPVSDLVTIVEVNDDSLAREGRWANWPRTRHAELITKLNEYGAEVITLDFVFDTETVDDDVLSETIAQAGDVVQPVLGQGDALRLDLGAMTFSDLILPNETVRASSAMLGHTNILHDEDGYVRQLPIVVVADDMHYPSIALASLLTFLNSQNIPLPMPENGKLAVAGREIPVGSFGEYLINYAGEPATSEKQTFNTVAYHDVLDGNVDPALIDGKIVLVGITATSEPDSYLTPVSNGRPMYGVEILANVIESIWSNRFIIQPSLFTNIILLLLLGVITGLLCTHPWRGLFYTVLLIVLYFALATYIFDVTGVMLDLLYPFMAILLSYALVTAYRYSVEVRRRRHLVSMFQFNINPKMAKETIAAVERGEVSLDGIFQDVSVLAIELRGFSIDGYLHSPTDIIQGLNEVRSGITEIILKHDGTMIQNDNDRITAVLNAPLPQPDHPMRVLKIALSLQGQLSKILASELFVNQTKINIGQGIYTGKAFVGYTQNESQATYTAFGETVQIAMQIAAQCTANQLLVGDATHDLIMEQYSVESEKLSPSHVRERVLPIDVYEIISVQN